MPKPPPRPHRGGRPPKPLDRRRRHRLRLHLTDAELAVLRERAELTALPVSCYIREAALGRRLSSRVNHKALAQLSRAGNLLNQLVRYTHMTHRPADVEAELVAAFRAVERAVLQLLDA